jgi:hypothetical protein
MSWKCYSFPPINDETDCFCLIHNASLHTAKKHGGPLKIGKVFASFGSRSGHP